MQITARPLNDVTRIQSQSSGRTYPQWQAETGNASGGWWILPSVLGGGAVWLWVVMAIFG